MKNTTAISLLTAAALILSGCSDGAGTAEIQVPLPDTNTADNFTTAEAQRYDIEEYVNVGADVGYVFAETLTVPYDTNLLEYNVKIGDRLNEGDVIAVFDASAFDYDIRNQEAVTESAYARYAASGSTSALLEYEENAKYLDLERYKADLCTIRAPYDCVICGTELITVGSSVEAGTRVCKVARPEDVYVSVKGNAEKFSFGMPVTLKFGTQSTFSGTVAMMPERNGENVLIRLDEGELDRANEETGGIATAGWGTVIVSSYTGLGVLGVPADAVMTYLGESYCYVEDNGSRVRVPVETGKTVNGITVILSGLTDGDKVSY